MGKKKYNVNNLIAKTQKRLHRKGCSQYIFKDKSIYIVGKNESDYNADNSSSLKKDDRLCNFIVFPTSIVEKDKSKPNSIVIWVMVLKR